MRVWKSTWSHLKEEVEKVCSDIKQALDSAQQKFKNVRKSNKKVLKKT
jgi:hypothetical protein